MCNTLELSGLFGYPEELVKLFNALGDRKNDFNLYKLKTIMNQEGNLEVLEQT